MAKIGGARAGAGRKPGSLNQRTVEMAAEILGSGKSPLAYLLEVMMDETAEQKRRDWAAEKAAAYLHPRPAPIPRSINIEMPAVGNASEVAAAIGVVVDAVAGGKVSPSEGQSLVSILEAQRKAIETEDIVKRLDDLEARLGDRKRGTND
ncbi:hypothetical protein DTW90_12095 [Neorhizobium sp. P12A]|uniref:hypothetical protein n=1 Tax=Neorhizobium sp. P12A TaxID=2268027 RepID=UPI0011EF4277|nr:hypothetical protein [Neorhizobium sp. P12A]KAA0698541.1 hypothetical protein DTW90_12095 [Neorhizobium sp. P12A]